MQEQRSPIKTPTTPSTPSFPLFATSPTRSHSRQNSVASTETLVPPQHCYQSLSSNTTPTGPTHSVPIIRPLPLRPALQTNCNSNDHRISKPSQQQQPPRRFSRGRSPSPIHTHSRIRTVSPHAQRHPLTYTHAVSHLSTKLIPLISVTTGLPHPAFPRSLLQYHLLTHAQLDELAVYYHQFAPPIQETGQYPVSIPAWVNRNGENVVGGVGLETKRRRWGRFLGLRGCESPTRRFFEESDEEREIRDRLEREWRRGIERRREEERLRGKAEGWRERW